MSGGFNEEDLEDDDEWIFNWAIKMSFNDRVANVSFRLDASRETDFWTNRMFIEALRDLADHLEDKYTNADNEHEHLRDIDH